MLVNPALFPLSLQIIFLYAYSGLSGMLSADVS